MAQGRPSRGESVSENLQDYIEESIQNSTDLPDQGAARDQDQAERSVSQGQMMPTAQSTSTDSTANITPGTEAALEEHLAATENMRGAAQSNETSAGAVDTTSTSIQNEARTRITDRTNDELGMGTIRR